MTLLTLSFFVIIFALRSDSAIIGYRNSNNLVEQINSTFYGTAKFRVPYIVSIQSIVRNRFEHLCAGSIIDESFVLTAAHCFHRIKNPKKLSIAVGSNILETTKTGIRHSVMRIIEHYKFVPLKGPDIALLKVAPKFKLDNKLIGKIDFNMSSSANKADAFLIGWGSVKKDVHPKLQLVSFRIMDTTACRRNGFMYVRNTEICAISHKERGACDGDSGGPLVNTEFNKQIGILSYGRKPCKGGHIYVFTKLSSLMDWINKNIQKFR